MRRNGIGYQQAQAKIDQEKQQRQQLIQQSRNASEATIKRNNDVNQLLDSSAKLKIQSPKMKLLVRVTDRFSTLQFNTALKHIIIKFKLEHGFSTLQLTQRVKIKHPHDIKSFVVIRAVEAPINQI